MPITFLDTIEFNKIAALNFVVPIVTSDPTPTLADEGRIIYNTTTDSLKYCDGSPQWITLGSAGAGGPPSGGAGGDLTGNYPNPVVNTNKIDNTKLAQMAANSFKGNNTGATANAADLTVAQAKTLLALVKADVGLGNVDNTSDVSKPISTATQTALNGKTDNTITVTAGGGLVGGGALSANRTFDVGAGTGITVNADDVAVNRTVTDTWYTAAGASAPPSGTAGGDLTGTYPNPTVGAGKVDNTKLATMAASSIKGNASGSVAAAADLTVAQVKTLLALTKSDVGLGNVDNTSDVNKPVSTAQQTALNAKLDLAGGTMTGNLILNADPAAALGAATKQYVDITAQGYSFKNPVRVVSTTNQAALSGLLTIDGITLVANDRVLLSAQTTTAQNGIYVAASGAWTRATDMDASGELKDGTLVPVAEGTVNQDSQWLCTSIGTAPWVPGTNTSVWVRQNSLADLNAGNGLTKTGTTVDFVAGNSTLTVAADSVVVASAPKWTTAQTETLSGDITGSASVDGSAGWTLNAQIAAGVIVDADINAAAAIAQSKISGLSTSLSGKVDTTRQVIAGAGLTGGGALSADATLNVVGDANLSVQADVINVLSAPKWTTARTVSLTGAVTGSASVDGSANVSIATTAGAPKAYNADVGTGAATSIDVVHNLNTLDVSVTLRFKSNNAMAITSWVSKDVNTVTLTFAAAPASASLRCSVIAAA